MDIGGAYLNADMSTGIIVYMRLDPTMTALLCQIAPKYLPFVEHNGTCVVKLDKALYGCVESAKLWFDHLKSTLIRDSFSQNQHDICAFNKVDNNGAQCTVVLHVDDLLITSVNDSTLDSVIAHLEATYKETRVSRGLTISYTGTFNFSGEGEMRITMEGYVTDLLAGCGVTGHAVTPATETLFDTRVDVELTNKEDKIWFHKYVAKLLYLCKRVRPECLAAVAFLATRVTKSD